MLMRKTIFTLLFMVLGIFTVTSIVNDMGPPGQELSYNIADVENGIEANGVIALEEATMQADLEVSLTFLSSIDFNTSTKEVEFTIIENGILFNIGNDQSNLISKPILGIPDRLEIDHRLNKIKMIKALAIPKDLTVNLKEVLTDFEFTLRTLNS